MPFYRTRIDVPASPDVAIARLRTLVAADAGNSESGGWVRKVLRRSTAGFVGEVGDGGFSIRRNIRYRNSFLPIIRGHVVATAAGARIDLTMFMHPLVGLFVLLWLGFIGRGVVEFAAVRQFDATGFAVCSLMFLFGAALTGFGFYSEAFEARRLIGEALSDET